MASQTRRHFADPHHPLVKTQYSHDQTGHCSICLLKLAGVRGGYGCYHCNIHVHSECTAHFKETVSFFAHPSHALKLSRILGLRTCDICRGHCPPGSFAYRCIGCGFNVHSLCAMLPERVGNLHMVSSSLPGSCSECHHPLPVWRYVCSSNGLQQLHVTCAIAIDPPTGAGNGSRNGPAGAARGGSYGGAGGRQRSIGGGPAGQGWYWPPPPPPIHGSYFGGPVFQGGYWTPPFQGSYFGAGVPFIQGGYWPSPFQLQGSYYPAFMPGGNGATGGHSSIFGNTSGLMTGIAGFLANVAINTVAGDFASQLLSAVLGC